MEVLTLDEYLGRLGLPGPISTAERNTAIDEYYKKIAGGEIRDKTALEKRIETANGDEDKESTRAARRRLVKDGIPWK